MADARWMEADCIHGVAWFECQRCGLEQRPHRQDSLTDQLADLHRVAVRLGMYDAADWLWKQQRDPLSVPDTGAEPLSAELDAAYDLIRRLVRGNEVIIFDGTAYWWADNLDYDPDAYMVSNETAETIAAALAPLPVPDTGAES